MDQDQLDQLNPVKQFINTPEPVAPQPMQSPDQSVNVRDPDTLEIGSIPSSQLHEAMGQGFQQVTPEEAQKFVREKEYGSVGQKSLAALEGAGVGLTFGVSTGLERMAGMDPKGINARAEMPQHMLGETAGIAGSAFIPFVGEANLMEHAGAAAASHLIPAAAEGFGAAKALAAARAAGVGVKEAELAYKTAKAAEPLLIKVGSAAANHAVQFGIMQGGDEVSKMFASDPNQTLQSAVTDIGLGALIGGAGGAAFGAVSPLWEATAGRKTEAFLEKLKNRVNGDTIPIGAEFETVLKDAPPEIRAALSEDPKMKQYYQQLVESGTGSGEALRATRDKFIDGAKENIQAAISPTENLSAFEAGEKAKQSLLDAAEKQHTEVRAKYDEVGDITGVQIPDKSRLKAYDSLIEQGQNFGAVGGPASELFKTYGERLLSQDTIGQVDQLITEINKGVKSVSDRAGDFQKSRALSEITEFMRNFQTKELDRQGMEIAKATGDEGAILAANLAKDQRADARASYKKLIDNLNDITSAGNIRGVKSYGQFQAALEKIPSAKLAEKLFDKKNIESLNYLKEKFPDVFETLVNQRKASLLDGASKSGTGELSHIKAVNSIKDLPKEVKNLMFTPEQLATVENSAKAINELSKRLNPSGTTRGLDTLWSHLQAGVGAGVSTLMGHGPIAGALIGEASQKLTRNAPDAIKLALIKFMGHSGPVDSGAFKAAVDYAEKAYRAAKLITNTTKSVFVPGAEVLSRKLMPDQGDRDKLDKKVKELQQNPETLFAIGGKTSYYLPDHGQAMSQTAMNAVNYLNSQRPQTQKNAPLDKDLPISFQQKSAYQRTLNVAQQPLVLMEHIKEGSLLPKDVIDLKQLYPQLHDKLSQELTNHMIEAVHKEIPIPYKTRQGLSMFLGQAMDSTFLPQSIQSAQSVFAQQNANQQAQVQQKPKGNMEKLGKMSDQFQTAGQGAQERQLSKH